MKKGIEFNNERENLAKETQVSSDLVLEAMGEFLRRVTYFKQVLESGLIATGTKKHIKAYFGSRGISIYSPAIGKVYVRYELIIILIALIALMFNWLWV